MPPENQHETERKILFLTVSDFPYGFGEPFLESELPFLCKHFDQVHIIITQYSEKNYPNHNDIIFQFPENCILQNFNFNLTRSEKIALSSVVRYKWWIFYEFYQIFIRNRSLPNFYKIKVVLAWVKKAHKYFETLKNYIQRIKTDNDKFLFYSYWTTEFTLGNILLSTYFKNSAVTTRAHGWDVYCERNPYSYLPFRTLILKKVDAFFTISEHGKNYIQQKYSTALPINVYCRPLGTPEICDHYEPPEAPDNQPLLILTLAFISPVKRLDLAAKSVEILLKENIAITWTHIGSGNPKYEQDFLASLENLRKKYSWFSYDYRGLKNKHQVKEILTNEYFDLLLNTSDYEGLPVSMMEAMSAGIPCVGRDVGGIREIIQNNVNGFLCPSKSTPEDIAKALKAYHLWPSEDKKKMRQNAYSTWKDKFSAEKNYEIFAHDLLKLLKTKTEIKNENSYKECARCVFNTRNYPRLDLGLDGLCQFCRTYDLRINQIKSKIGSGELEEIIQKIKKHKGKYNCIVGVSGGIDSSYTVYYAKKILGLNPLAVHLDNGWNSEIAVQNIRNVLEHLNVDLYTHVIEWDEFKDLQMAYLKASVVDIEVLTDHAIIATLYRAAKKFGIKYILSGENFTTEGVLPPEWVFSKIDLVNLKAIHKRFGKRKIKTFPTLGILKKLAYEKIWGIRYIPLLEYVHYDKKAAKELLKKECGWRDYGGKHHESTFTKIYQTCILPDKFGIDKRISHFSTLICAGQMDREEALKELKKPAISEEEKENLLKFLRQKFNLSETEWYQIMQSPPVPHTYYPSHTKFLARFREAVDKLL
ncbi:MAG: N-acetyl sugar amidotransferase [Flavobacteriales bacterium]|nr:N-acetyl sugar amidotransferase [Flavobacteriales bacterium]